MTSKTVREINWSIQTSGAVRITVLGFPIALSNLPFVSSGAANESVPDASAHPNKETSQEGNIPPPVRKLTTPRVIGSLLFYFIIVFSYLHK